MMLLVDAGNTRIKWRIIDGYQLIATGVALTGDWAELNAAWQPFKLTQAVLSFVAPASVHAGLAKLLQQRGIEAHWLLAERERHGVLNHYTAPEKLGADRYAGLIAAARLKLGDCVVASVGTATTVDQLDRNAAFLGGIILPGPDMMRAALLRGTGQIESRMQSDATCLPTELNLMSPPRDTAAAVETGIVLAQVGAIDAMCQNMCLAMASSADASPVLILTGGARAQVRAGLRRELIEIEDLVLDGLAWIGLELNCVN
jgi:type III pantothenate kinase